MGFDIIFPSCSVIGGRYRVLERIGKGSFGLVHKCEDLETHCVCAIKTLPHNVLMEESERVSREVDVLIHLTNKHPHVVSLQEVFVTSENISGLPGDRIALSSFEHEQNEAVCGRDNTLKRWILNAAAATDHIASLLAKEFNLPEFNRCVDYVGRKYNVDTIDLITAKPLHPIQIHFVMELFDTDLYSYIRRLRLRPKHIHNINIDDMQLEKTNFIEIHDRKVRQCPTEEVVSSPTGTAKEDALLMILIAFHMAYAFDYLSKSGITHRDLKPANCLIKFDPENSYRSRAVVTDFGLACQSNTSSEFYVVTRPYRPPELILGRTDSSVSIDVWSLGAIFYEMCTCEILFNMETGLTRGKVSRQKTMQQLECILDIVGTPSKEDIDIFMPSNTEGDEYIKEDLKKIRRRPSVLKRKLLENWNLACTYEERDQWINLIESCLKFFPAQRPDMEMICRHELFKMKKIYYDYNIKRQHPEIYVQRRPLLSLFIPSTLNEKETLLHNDTSTEAEAILDQLSVDERCEDFTARGVSNTIQEICTCTTVPLNHKLGNLYIAFYAITKYLLREEELQKNGASNGSDK